MSVKLTGDKEVLRAIAKNIEQGLEAKGYDLAAQLWRNYYQTRRPEMQISADHVRNEDQVKIVMTLLEEQFKDFVRKEAEVLNIPRNTTSALTKTLFLKIYDYDLSEPLEIALGDFYIRGVFNARVTRSKTSDFSHDWLEGSVSVEWNIAYDKKYGKDTAEFYSGNDPKETYRLKYNGNGEEMTLRVDNDFAGILAESGLASPFFVRAEWTSQFQLGLSAENPRVKKKCGRDCKEEALSPCDFPVWAYPDEPAPPCHMHD